MEATREEGEIFLGELKATATVFGKGVQGCVWLNEPSRDS